MKKMLALIVTTLMLGSLFLWAQAESAQDSPVDWDVAVETVEDLVNEARIRMEKVTDYTCTVYWREYVRGKLLPREIIEVKFMRPYSLYMKWVEGRRRGRELIYRRGWNDGKIKVHEGGWLKKRFVVNIDPDSPAAMKDSRHSVSEMGIGRVIDLFAYDMKLIKEDPARETVVADLGMKVVHGQESRCFETTMPKDRYPELYAHKTVVCYDIHELIPLWVQVWDVEDGDLRLVEDYRYADVRLNADLTPWDFDPRNPEYEF